MALNHQRLSLDHAEEDEGEDDGTGLYHSYDCEHFTKSKFWAYSRRLAEANGYHPCPLCGG